MHNARAENVVNHERNGLAKAVGLAVECDNTVMQEKARSVADPQLAILCTHLLIAAAAVVQIEWLGKV